MRILITGITGSGGSYLAEYINTNTNDEIFGTTRAHNDINHRNIRRVKNKINLTCVDLTDFPSLLRFLDKNRFDIIFHIASIANVRESFDNPTHIINNNINITLNLFEVIRLLKEKDGYNPVCVSCSSSECYGNPEPKHIPINENCPLKPINPYAVSKMAQDNLSYVYFLNYGLNIIRTRMFSYFNAKRLDLFASAFAKQILDIKNGKKENLLIHGNLSSIRTMIDVRDAAESYYLTAIKGRVGEVYNIGGTIQTSVGDILQKLIEISNIKINTRQEQSLLRPSDVCKQVPDISKFTTDTGWKLKYDLKESLDFFWKEMNEFWVNK